MENHDELFETYLSEFQPRRPRALPEPGISRQIRLRRAAAAAMIAVTLGASLWLVREKDELSGRELAAKSKAATPHAKPTPPSLPLLLLTQMALEGPQQLDAELTRASRKVLPDFRGTDSTLRVLAKE